MAELKPMVDCPHHGPQLLDEGGCAKCRAEWLRVAPGLDGQAEAPARPAPRPEDK